MSRATVTVELERGEAVDVFVRSRKRVSEAPSGPGLAAVVVESEGTPIDDWAEVVELDERRGRRAS